MISPFEVLHLAASSSGASPASIPAQGPDLIGGTLLMNSNSYTTRVRLHGGPTARALLSTVAPYWTLDHQLRS